MIVTQALQSISINQSSAAVNGNQGQSISKIEPIKSTNRSIIAINHQTAGETHKKCHSHG